MEPEELFIRTLDDLRRSIYSPDEYEVLRASHLLRQLLLDGTPLFRVVNRIHKLKNIEFSVAVNEPPTIPGLPYSVWCALDGIDPDSCPPNFPRRSLSLEAFLKVVMAVTDGHTHTVHDIIDYLAHVAGGVHLGRPKSDAEKAMADLQKQFVFMDMTAASRMIRAIGRVVLRGLAGLRCAVLCLDRFANAPGFSLHATLSLLPMPGGSENYIFDVGSEEDRNRVSLFLDAHGDLCLRVYDPTGRVRTVRGGGQGAAYLYDQPFRLACEVGQAGEETLIRLEGANWDVLEILRGYQAPVIPEKPLPYTEGSDLLGRSRARMTRYETIVFSRILDLAGGSQLRQYLNQRLAAGYPARLVFEPGQFLSTAGVARQSS